MEKSLLIIHPGALGDFVATFPVIRKLRKRFRRIDALCQRELATLAVELAIADRGFPLEAASTASLFSDSPDPVISGFLKPYTIVLLFSFSESLRETIEKTIPGQVFRIPPRPRADLPLHVAVHIASHLAAIGLMGPKDAAAPETTNTQEKHHNPKQTGTGSSVLLHPGSGSRHKRWALRNFVRVAESLCAMKMQPEFLVGPAESFLLEKIRRFPATVQVHEVSDMGTLLGVLRASSGFIGNDSGVSHLAAFLGLPTVAVFGPSDPRRWTPTGRAVIVVRPDLSCAPCFETNPGVCDHRSCLEKTTPSAVIRAFQTLIGTR